jgi:hypothetical protein
LFITFGLLHHRSIVCYLHLHVLRVFKHQEYLPTLNYDASNSWKRLRGALHTLYINVLEHVKNSLGAPCTFKEVLYSLLDGNKYKYNNFCVNLSSFFLTMHNNCILEVHQLKIHNYTIVFLRCVSTCARAMLNPI